MIPSSSHKQQNKRILKQLLHVQSNNIKLNGYNFGGYIYIILKFTLSAWTKQIIRPNLKLAVSIKYCSVVYSGEW